MASIARIDPTSPNGSPSNRVPIGTTQRGPLELDLDRLLAGRLLIQGSSGAGKSLTLRRIVEEAFDFVTTIIVDPEGEFANLAEHIGATSLCAQSLSAEGLVAAGLRSREHRLSLHLDLSDLDAEQRIRKAAAFFSGLMSAPQEHWANTVLVCIDEGHLLAPHVAAFAHDAETRRLGVAALTDLCARGRKRGIAPIVATQRLAKLSASVTSELQNFLVGLNVFDRDISRAADLLGFSARDSDALRKLAPGEFYAMGPALSVYPVVAKIDATITTHSGATPSLQGAADIGGEEARKLLDLDRLTDIACERRDPALAMKGIRALDAFLLDPRAPAATRVISALAKITPNATTASELCKHLALDQAEIDDALDLLGGIAAIDTSNRGETRIARLNARLRIKASVTDVVGLA